METVNTGYMVRAPTLGALQQETADKAAGQRAATMKGAYDYGTLGTSRVYGLLQDV